MKVVGLITEYNPLHNGHLYHIQKAREQANADYVIVVMSGNFVQRGSCAITDKYTRTAMALKAGADLVFELPVYYATASAEAFAYGAVSLLDELQVVDTLVFGCESGDVKQLQAIAEFLLHEPEHYKQQLRSYLSKGVSYPMARAYAYKDWHSASNLDTHFTLLSQPNSILGIEYCKAVKKRNSNIKPMALRRVGSNYHDLNISQDFCSASAIRKEAEVLAQDNLLITDSKSFQMQIPTNSLEQLKASEGITFPILENDFSLPLRTALVQAKSLGKRDFYDVSDELLNRIYKHTDQCIKVTEFIRLLKTKDITYTAVSRALLHVLLDLTEKEVRDALSEQVVNYARVLGLRKSSSELIRIIKTNSTIPFITKIAGIENILSNSGLQMFHKDLYAAELYTAVASNKFQQILPNEYTHSLIYS